MHAYVHNEHYISFKSWSEVGFCMHSDWVWGYFTNFYGLAIRNDDPIFSDVEEDRLRGYLGSLIYAGPGRDEEQGQCLNDYSQGRCSSASHICHYVQPEGMNELYSSVMV
jgi:hypothetical protein